MRPPANYRNQASTHAGWLPPEAATRRAPDFSHWLTRAARGHTWNGRGVTQRRRPS
jgi:hypothetical protein